MQKILYFLFKKIIQCGDGDGTGIPELVGNENGFNFSSPLGMGRVTGKYIRIGYGDGECKTRPHPAPMPCLVSTTSFLEGLWLIVCIDSMVTFFTPSYSNFLVTMILLRSFYCRLEVTNLWRWVISFQLNYLLTYESEISPYHLNQFIIDTFLFGLLLAQNIFSSFITKIHVNNFNQ